MVGMILSLKDMLNAIWEKMPDYHRQVNFPGWVYGCPNGDNLRYWVNYEYENGMLTSVPEHVDWVCLERNRVSRSDNVNQKERRRQDKVEVNEYCADAFLPFLFDTIAYMDQQLIQNDIDIKPMDISVMVLDEYYNDLYMGRVCYLEHKCTSFSDCPLV